MAFWNRKTTALTGTAVDLTEVVEPYQSTIDLLTDRSPNSSSPSKTKAGSA